MVRGNKALDLRLNEWHVVFAVTGDEERVKERIKYRLSDDYTVMVPKRKLKIRKGGIWSVETKVLFPGYVLINGVISPDIYYRLKNIPSVLKLLKTGTAVAQIEKSEMTVISKLICNSEEIGFSKVLVENGQVRVVDGPLFSLEGIILKIDHRKERAKVRLNFLGEERTVDLGISLIAPV
jgi:transcriptional antiterminator NusG